MEATRPHRSPPLGESPPPGQTPQERGITDQAPLKASVRVCRHHRLKEERQREKELGSQGRRPMGLVRTRPCCSGAAGGAGRRDGAIGSVGWTLGDRAAETGRSSGTAVGCGHRRWPWRPPSGRRGVLPGPAGSGQGGLRGAEVGEQTPPLLGRSLVLLLSQLLRSGVRRHGPRLDSSPDRWSPARGSLWPC